MTLVRPCYDVQPGRRPAPIAHPPEYRHVPVDVAREKLYLADFGGPEPALIVVDLDSGRAWRVLAGHESVRAMADLPVRVGGEVVTMGTGEDAQPARVGVNPITIDPTNTWVYYGAMSGNAIHRLPAVDLAAGMSGPALEARIERYGDKPVSDGITIDTGGNVYVSDLGAGAIGVTGADGRYRVLVRDGRLQWPDGFAAGPDGYVYVTVNQLHRSAPLNRGRETAAPPYHLFRFRPLAPVVPGR